MSPFSIAAIQGHLDVAKAIIEIVQIQYKPKEQRGQRRYVMEGEDGDDPEALQGDDEIQIYSELIDDQFTIENIGEVATQVECPITPLQVFSWECAARLFTEQDGLSKRERVAIQSKVEYISEGGRRMYWFPFSEPALRAPQNLVEYAVWTDNISLLVFLLELGQDLTNRQAEANSPIYTVPEQAFQRDCRHQAVASDHFRVRMLIGYLHSCAKVWNISTLDFYVKIFHTFAQQCTFD